MPSSTSSSEPRRIPTGDWRGIWLVALAVAIGVTGLLEHATRAHGQRPSVVDDAVWWGVRRQAIEHNPHVVALLGTSRMELAYSASAFAAAAPRVRAVQLAIDGMPPLGVLEDLAADDDFVGTAVVDVAEWDLARPDAFTATRAYVERSHALWRAPGALVNRWLGSRIQEHLALLSVGGRELIAAAGERRWPEPRWVVMARDRTFQGDYSLATRQELRKRGDKAVGGVPASAPDPEAWLAVSLPRIEVAVARIRARGGNVVFVHLPITGRLAEAVERVYPRARYWSLFEARSSAPVIDLRQVPAIAALRCPDGMHLDQRDQATFTTALVDVLRGRHLLPE